MNRAAPVTSVLLAAAFITSFFFHGGDDIAYAPALFLILAAALASILPQLGGRLSLPSGIAVLATLAFWIYISLSLTWSSVPFASLVTWLNLTALPLVLLTLLCAPDRAALIRQTSILMAGAVVVVALYALWQFFIEGLNRAPGVMANPNNMATLINMALLPLIACLVTGGRRQRLITGAACIVLFAGLLTTGSRGGLLCFGAGALLLGFLLFPALKRQGKAAALFIAVLAIVFAAFLLFSHTALEHSLRIFGDPVLDYSSYERLDIWKAAFAMLRDHLFAGTGLGTFYLYYPPYRLPGDTSSMGHWAHFDALQFGVECGVVALLLFYAVIGAWLARSVASLRRAAADDPRRALIAGCVAALAALTLHAHIEFQFYITSILILAAVLMAALYDLGSEDDEDRSYIIIDPAPREKLIWRGALAVTALLLALTTASTAAGYYFVAQAQEDMRKGDIDGFFTAIERAYRFAPRSFTDADIRLAAFYLDLLAQPPLHMTDADRQEIYNNTEKLLNDAQISNPALADIDHKRARLYMQATNERLPGRLSQIDRHWQEALRKDPLHFAARADYARFLISQGKVEEAYDILNDGQQWPMTHEARTVFQNLSAQLAPLVLVKRQFQHEREEAP